MMSPFVKIYIYEKAKHNNMKLSNVEEILKRELEPFSFWHGKIKYAWFWSAGVRIPNASATLPGTILINAEWAARIVLEQDNPYMHDAFALTVYHEISHHKNDFSYFDFWSKNGRFVNWVNEVHADFRGTKMAFDGKREQAAAAMKYKLCNKRKDRDQILHPSWNRRIDYILNFDFNHTLIDQIAMDTGCKDTLLIEAVKKHYDNILLMKECE